MLFKKMIFGYSGKQRPQMMPDLLRAQLSKLVGPMEEQGVVMRILFLFMDIKNQALLNHKLYGV